MPHLLLLPLLVSIKRNIIYLATVPEDSLKALLILCIWRTSAINIQTRHKFRLVLQPTLMPPLHSCATLRTTILSAIDHQRLPVVAWTAVASNLTTRITGLP